MLELLHALKVYLNKPSVRFNNRVIYLALITPFFMSKVRDAHKAYAHPVRGMIGAFLVNAGSAFILSSALLSDASLLLVLSTTVALSLAFYLGTYTILEGYFRKIADAKGLNYHFA
ncbi:hypothetical protein [Thiothrix nivea]|uniref:Uncharacterized protein n=1 Tax=Thiothrix nivea (strain ATCC 35100 / DSM 5205 / JP2) TaxID=870187 RepID=A0A656HFR9_THINJ|nr:hypothetical protein [Thiothrix nivea]EIJ35297.1 hypothetical protein Thini_2760 [Thiothrix nivea DSM 5205]